MTTIMQDITTLSSFASTSKTPPDNQVYENLWGHVDTILALFTIVDNMVQEELHNNEHPSASIVKVWLDGAEMLGFHRGLPDPDDSYFEDKVVSTPKGDFRPSEKVILTRDTVFHIRDDEMYRTTFEAGDYAKFFDYVNGEYWLVMTDPWGWVATVDADFFRKADDES